MKPIDYSKTERYGRAMAEGRARDTYSPMQKKAPVDIEAAFYSQGMQHSLQLGYMGLQKDQFEQGLAESKRQFDVSTTEGKRQFQANLDFSRDQFKHQRRQGNRAEILGMVNVGMGIGYGYLQYKHNRKQITMNKMMMGVMQKAQAKV